MGVNEYTDGNAKELSIILFERPKLIWTLLGVRYRHPEVLSMPGLPKGDVHVISVPYWSMLLVPAMPFAFAIARWRRRRSRIRRGLCLVCGYDLRATPDRCPECGTSVPTKLADADAK